MQLLRSTALCVLLMTSGGVATAGASPCARPARATEHDVKGSRIHRLIHKASWMGVGTAAHHFAGAIGSVAVGVARHHEELATNWHTRRRAALNIGLPIVIGATTGLFGSAAYEAFEHRQWIARHWPFKKHQPRQCP